MRFFPTILTAQHLDQAIAFSGNPKRYENAFGIYPQSPTKEFVERFETKFSRKPKVFSAEGYDAVRFLIPGIENGIKFTKAGFTYSGVTGEHRIALDHRDLIHGRALTMHTLPSGNLEEEDPNVIDTNRH